MALGDLTQSLAADPAYGTSDPETVKRRQLAAMALMNQGTSTEPIRSPWQGAANLAKALMGGYQSGAADREAAAGRASAAALGLPAIGGASATHSQAMTTADATPTDAPNAPADQMARAKERMAYLVNEKGLPPTVAAGLVGNAWHESGGLFPTIVGDGGNSRGEFQFNTGGEQPAFLAFAAANKRDPNDWKTQYDFVHTQLQGPYKNVLGQMTAAATPADAALAFSKGYERPQEGAEYNDRRIRWANTAAGLIPQAGAPTQVASTDPNFVPQSSAPDQWSNRQRFDYSQAGPNGAPLVGASASPMQDSAPVFGNAVGVRGGVQPQQAAPAPPQSRLVTQQGAPAPAPQEADAPDAPAPNAQTAGPAPANVAQAGPAAPAAAPQNNANLDWARRVMSNPWSSQAQMALAQGIVKDAMTPKEKYSDPYMDAKGNYVQRASDGSIKVINAAKDSVDKEDNKNHVLGPGAQLVDRAGKVLAKNDGNIPTNDAQTEQTVDFLAERVIAGDRQALQNIGRGAQGGALVQAVQQRVAQKAAERGLNAKDLLGNQAQQQGANAEQRTLGTQNARVASAATEAMGAADQAQQAMDALPRTNFVPANKIWQNIESAQSDPNLKQAALALMTLKNTYARAINPNGTPHQGDKEHFDQIMSTADGPAATKAAIDQIRRETAMAQQSPAKAMKILENVRKGKDPMDGVSHDFNTQGIPPMVGAPGEGAQPVGPWDMAKKVLGIGTPSIAPGAIEMLKSNPTPEMRGHFDRKYGEGAAAKVLGQ